MKSSAEKEFLDFIDALSPTASHDELAEAHMIPDGLDELLTLDPFGPEYRSRVTKMYGRISARDDYIPSRDEKSGIDGASDLWTNSSPFFFNDTVRIGEFLTSWGAIFKGLDMAKGQSVLEYGAGSGQVLILLARSGIKAFGVDIDPESLRLLRRQSDSMGLDIQLQQGEFGQGFDGRKFDRILFFEAFHHCLDFENLLLGLHEKLNPGGRIIFCGEPITAQACPPVPYPWGPRADGLSVYCIRRNGWMELGFTRDFFIQALMRNGWSLTFQESPTFRANVYVARQITDEIPIVSDVLLLGGWSAPEHTHRWTIANQARVPLPVNRFKKISVAISVANFLGEEKTLRFSVGGGAPVQRTLGPGERAQVELTAGYPSADLIIETDRLSVVPGDDRTLGIAVESIKIRPIS